MNRVWRRQTLEEVLVIPAPEYSCIGFFETITKQ